MNVTKSVNLPGKYLKAFSFLIGAILVAGGLSYYSFNIFLALFGILVGVFLLIKGIE